MSTRTTTCPSWCTAEHDALHDVVDVLHESAPLHTVQSSADDAGRVELAWWKYDRSAAELEIDVRIASPEHAGAAVVLSEADARDLAANLVSLADRVAATT